MMMMISVVLSMLNPPLESVSERPPVTGSQHTLRPTFVYQSTSFVSYWHDSDDPISAQQR